MKYANKAAFLSAVKDSWSGLLQVYRDLDEQQRTRRVRFSAGALAWSPADVCGHIHAWHRLCLAWHRDGQNGVPQMPAPGFSWRETPRLNRTLWNEFRDVTPSSILRRMKRSHGRLMKFVEPLSNAQLMRPGHFEWTGRNGFISYVSANTDSHYRWAKKKINRIIKS